MKSVYCDCLLGTVWIRDNLFTLDFHHLQLIIYDETLYASAHLVVDADKIEVSVLLLRLPKQCSHHTHRRCLPAELARILTEL